MTANLQQMIEFNIQNSAEAASLIDEGETVVIRFEGGIESCEKTDLSTVSTPLQAISPERMAPPA